MARLRTVFAGIAGLAGLGFLISLLNQLLFSYYFGTSAQLDAYWLALSLIQILTFYVVPAREALVPEFSRRLARDSGAVHAYFSSAVNLLALMLISGTALLLFMPRLFGGLVVGGTQSALLDQVATMIVLLAPLAILMPGTELFGNVLVAYGRVMVQNTVRLASALMLTACLVLMAPGFGVHAAAAGVVAGQIAAFGLLCGALARNGLRYEWRAKPAVDQAFMKLAGALLFSYGVSQIYVVVERNTLSFFGEGVVSAYQYASSLSQVPQMVLIASLATAIWPQALDAAREGNRRLAADLVVRGWDAVAPILGLGMTFGLLFAKPVLYVLFFRGAFDERSLELTTRCLTAIVLGLPFLGLTWLAGRVLVSHQAGSAIAAIGAGAAITGVIVVLAGRLLDDLSLSLMHVVVNAVSAAVLSVVALRRTLGSDVWRWFRGEVLWTFTVLLVTSLALWVVYPVPQFEAKPQLRVAADLLLHLAFFSVAYGLLYWLLTVFRRWLAARIPVTS
jgi:putative peptidoglycan lipid II flippase